MTELTNQAITLTEMPAVAEAAETTKGLKEWRKTRLIHPSQIRRRPGFNKRMDFGDIASLAGSMRVQKEKTGQALLEQIAVQKDKEDPNLYWLVDGDRRLTAAEFLYKNEGYDVGELISKVYDKNEDVYELMATTVTHNESKPFLPIEEAMVYLELKQQGWTLERICAHVGKSVMLVQSRINLLEHGAEEVIEQVKSGELQVQVAQEIVRQNKGDKEEQVRLSKKAAGSKTAQKEVRKELKAKAAANKKKREAKKAVKSDEPAVKRLSQEEVSQLATLYASKVESFEEEYQLKPQRVEVVAKFNREVEEELPNYRKLGLMMADLGIIEGMAMALGLE